MVQCALDSRQDLINNAGEESCEIQSRNFRIDLKLIRHQSKSTDERGIGEYEGRQLTCDTGQRVNAKCVSLTGESKILLCVCVCV